MLQPSAPRRFPARDPNRRPTARVSGIKQGRRPSTTAGIDLTTSTTPATTTTVTSQRLAGVASKRRPNKENIQNTLDAVIDILGLDKEITSPEKKKKKVVRRGAHIETTASGTYQAYTFDDVVRICKAIEDGTMKLEWLDPRNKNHDPEIMQLPKTTAKDTYLVDDHKYNTKKHGKPGMKGVPRWKAMSEARRITSLPSMGAAPVLSDDVESALMIKIADQARQGTPYTVAECKSILRELCINFDVRISKTNSPYSATTNVDGLWAAFRERSKQKGVPIAVRNGIALSEARAANANVETVLTYRDAKLRPALVRFQEKHGNIGQAHVGNFDECAVDLNDYVHQDFAVIDDSSQAHVITKYERAPHITVLLGYIGLTTLDPIVIRMGKSAPNSAHLVLTRGNKPSVHLASNETGWMTMMTKAAAFNIWRKSPDNDLGKVPVVMNADGHNSNTLNVELCEEAYKHNCLLPITPAHLTAQGLQQLDLKDGLINRFKTRLKTLLAKQMAGTLRQEGKGELKLSVILRLLQMALAEAHDPEKNIRDNEKVGYFINPLTGGLDFNPMVTLNQSFVDKSTLFDPNPVDYENGLNRRSIQAEIKQNLEAERARMSARLKELDTTLSWIEEKPVQDVPTHAPIRNNRSANADGVIISSPSYIKDLQDNAAAKLAAEEKVHQAKLDKVAKAIAKWGPKWRKAEEKLAAGTSPSKLSVSEMNAMIRRKTGNATKAKNNKDGAMLTELRGVLTNINMLLTPKKSGNAGEDEDEDEDGEPPELVSPEDSSDSEDEDDDDPMDVPDPERALEAAFDAVASGDEAEPARGRGARVPRATVMWSPGP